MEQKSRTKSSGARRKRRTKRRIRPIRLLIALLICFTLIFYGFKTAIAACNYLIEKYNIGSTNVATDNETSSEDKTEFIDEPTSKPHSVKKNSWNLLLVNPWNKLPKNFDVERTVLNNGHSIDARAYPDLQDMMDDCRAEGLSPLICSSYRTVERQQTLLDQQIEKYMSQGYSREDAEKEGSKWVAIPGTSEHHTGLAVDIVSVNNQNLNEEQENTEEQKWLMENCYKYGFILRYPKDKTDITGIVYEPWHYRYVGKEVAKEIYEQGICLEEYLDTVTEEHEPLLQTYTKATTSSSKNLLVNDQNPIPEDFMVSLAEVDDKLGGRSRVAEEIVAPLDDLMESAQKDQIELCINSGYRSFQDQKELLDEKINSFMGEGAGYNSAKEKALEWVALPGHSEHQTGLAIDFGVLGQTTWEEGYDWLARNAFKFGFILRYPQEKTGITKVANEPWHFRYVGAEVAKQLTKNSLCLEEYV